MRYMKGKKGFTMVELLAVVAILAILVILVIPNVLRLFKEARKNTFVTEAKSLYGTVMKTNFLNTREPKVYSTGSLNLTGGKDLEYSISTNQLGQIVCFQVADSNYMWIYRSKGIPLRNEDDIAVEDEIAERDYDVIIDCNGAQNFDVTVPATLGAAGSWWEGDTDKSKIERIIFTYSYTSTDYDETFYSDGEKVGGLVTYVKDNIAYVAINRNKRKSKAIKMPADSSNTFSEFTNLKYISGLKLLDFSGVTNMDYFFGKAMSGEITSSKSLSYINGYESFNTANVTSAKYAFAGVKLSSLNLGNWNVSNLQDASGMFYKTNATVINLSGWNVTKVSNFTNMFNGNSRLESINLAGWHTNPNSDYTGMFNECGNLVSITADNAFKVSNTNVTMFKNDKKLIGANGTTYSTDKSSHARVDKDGAPGYFSLSTSDGIVSAKLYNGGSASGAYTELTSAGSVPPDWNYYSGARLLEVKLFSMKTGSTKTLDISVPAGMYIVNNSWTKSGSGISSVNFTKLASQGTGAYSNPQTGTLKYTFNSNATSGSVQLLVMFDATIWDKNKKDASAMGTDNMTSSAPIVVNYNNGSSIRKISNIHSAVGLGNTSNGLGYSFYSWNYNSNIYVDIPTVVLGNHYLLSSDQSTASYFYKKVTYETYATFKNQAGETVYAEITPDIVPAELSGMNFGESTSTVYKGEATNVYNNGAIHFPRPKYNVKTSDNPQLNTNLTVYIKASVTTLSGQTRTMSTSKTYKIKSGDLDITDLVVSSGEKTSPSESYYGDSGYSGVLGIFTLYNKGYADFNNVKVVFEYDTGTAANTAPSIKVLAARPFLQKNQEADAKITLINDSGSTVEAPSYKIKSSNTSDGAYVSAASVAESLGLSGNYYLKKIEYVIPKVSGTSGSETNSTNYLYHSSGSSSQSSGGNFLGLISKQATSKCSIYYNDSLIKTVTSTSKITTSPSFSGYISKINTPLGTEFTAGDDIELAINVNACSYPYTTTQAFSKPEVYLVLPFGINIESVIIGSSASVTTSEIQPVVTKVKTMEIDDELNNVYKITTNDKTWFGYVTIKSSGATGGPSTSKWFRVKLNTDIAMEYTSFNLRDRVLFKDASGQISVSGSYALYSESDRYDVDNDGSTSDKFGTISSATQKINIYSAEEED